MYAYQGFEYLYSCTNYSINYSIRHVRYSTFPFGGEGYHIAVSSHRIFCCLDQLCALVSVYSAGYADTCHKWTNDFYTFDQL
jgi:hypothetical protein